MQRNFNRSGNFEDTYIFDNDVSSPNPILLESEDGDILQPELVSDAAFATWREQGIALAFDATGHQWALGDWVIAGEELKEVAGITRDQRFKHGIYSVAAEVLGLTVATIKDYAYVARKVPQEMRNPKLTFGHHKLVAAMPEERQLEMLSEIELGGLTVGDARRRVQYLATKGQEQQPEKSIADKRAEQIVMLCGPLTRFLSKPYMFAGEISPNVRAALLESVSGLRKLLESELESVHTDA